MICFKNGPTNLLCRRICLCALLITLLFAHLPVDTTASQSEPPNVLLIISDDLTANALSCYGNAQCRTPHIDGLARRGMRFTRAYCQFPVCGPSRAALLSGMYPQSIGVTRNGHSNRFTRNLGSRPSLPQWFRDNGYYTARVSKIYHMRVPGDITAGVDGPDHADSWSERFNCQGPEWMTTGKHQHLSNQRLRKDPDRHYGLGFGTAFYVVQGDGDGIEQADYQAASKAIQLLKKHRDERFFLAVGLVRPHVPLVAPADSFADYEPEQMRLAASVEGDRDDIPKLGLSMSSRSIGLVEKRSQQQVLAAYYATVSFMDAQVGRILTTLQQLELDKKTIVIFTSDHGYHLGEHSLWQKLSLHEESARIPLIISAPGHEPSVSDSLAQQIDLFPTLAELCQLEVPEHCQGKSLAGVLKNPGHQVNDYAYCMHGRGELIRTREWALLAYVDGTYELYDMLGDPQQFTNLAGNPDCAKVLAEMQQRLQQHRQGLPETKPHTPR